MTGRELILYILANGLEDEPVFQDGTFIGFVSETKFACEMGVGTATVRAWANTGAISCIRIGDIIYIPANYLLQVKNRLNHDI